MQVKVLFFGVLAEVTGINHSYYREVKSLGDLNLRILDDYPEIMHYKFRISLNNMIIENDPVLKDGDEVALLPPFAGG